MVTPKRAPYGQHRRENGQVVRVHAALTPATEEKVILFANKLGISRSELLRTALNDYLRRLEAESKKAA